METVNLKKTHPPPEPRRASRLKCERWWTRVFLVFRGRPAGRGSTFLWDFRKKKIIISMAT